MTEEYLIRARLDRLGLTRLTDAVLTSGLPWPDVRALAALAVGVMAAARNGQEVEPQLILLSQDWTIPDRVYDQLCALVAEATASYRNSLNGEEEK